MKTRRISSILWLLLGLAALGSVACSPPPPRPPRAASKSPEQAIVERSAEAFRAIRRSAGADTVDSYLERARGVMIFPRLVKASLLFGGGGGNGVLVARGKDGAWSSPAFYSLGAPSVGLQIGYQEATVVFFLMDDAVLQRALHADVTLGANTSVALGRVGEADRSQGEILSKPIYQLVEARGAFVGASFDGYVISARNKHNEAYYGAPVTPRGILLEQAFRRPEAAVLLDALAPPR